MQPPLITGPIPPYNNPPIEPQFFTPRNYVISDITLGQLTVVTTTVPHDYVIGQLVRMLIPPTFGTRQLNELTAFVVDIPSTTQVTLDISSLEMDAFVNSSATTKPQIVAVGDINNGTTNTQGRRNNITYIPGSFRNISPL